MIRDWLGPRFRVANATIIYPTPKAELSKVITAQGHLQQVLDIAAVTPPIAEEDYYYPANDNGIPAEIELENRNC